MGNYVFNANGGLYKKGVKIAAQTLCDIIQSYAAFKEENGGDGDEVPWIEVAAEARVAVNTAKKYCGMFESEGFGALGDYMDPEAGSDSGGGPGSQTLDSRGIEVLMRYYEQFPSASLLTHQF